MRAGRSLRPLVAKELRELGPLWLGAIAFVATCSIVLPGQGIVFGLSLYALAAVALGAMSMGHEYRHRTLGLLLAQPVRRSSVLLAKFGVLLGLLVLLGASVWTVWSLDEWRVAASAASSVGPRMRPNLAMVGLPLACGLFLAPWLTMLCRSELAGMVFAAAVPAVLWIAGQVVAVRTYGMSTLRDAEIVALRSAIVEPAMVVACVVGAVGSVYWFLNLQETGGRATEVRLPSWLRVGDTTAQPGRGFGRRSPYWMLAKKEVRLQHLPFALAVLFAIAWVGLAWSQTGDSQLDLDTLRKGLSVFYVGTVTMLVGAIASAEERQLGTLPAQSLVPMAAWKLWTVKVVCALSVLAVLTVAVPWALGTVAPGPSGVFGWPRNLSRMYLLVSSAFGSLFVLSLYVSSVNTGGLRAFLVTIGAVVAAGSALGLVVDVMNHLAGSWLSRALVEVPWLGRLGVTGRAFSLAVRWMSLGFGAAIAVLLFRLAMVNHRFVERPAAVVRRQVAWISVAVLSAVVIQTCLLVVLNAAWVIRIRQSRRTTPAPISARPPASNPAVQVPATTPSQQPNR